MDPFASKDSLLRKADALLGEARRARKSAAVAAEGERGQLMERAQELERQAARLERDAVSAKNGVPAPSSNRPPKQKSGIGDGGSSRPRGLAKEDGSDH
jgi:hypothetical protein